MPPTDALEDLLAREAGLIDALDRYREHASGTPSRTDTVLLILRDWLGTNGYLRSNPLAALDRQPGEFPVELSEHDKPA